ncbi:DUF7389 domain-containing protein [Halostella pelagica]|uniref:DUF7389 domain-containing protein n=1 Tax=Halostella pelagica TaxID=2583824 RepID=UPI00108092A0|nr:hypothetical protein [Halostella pelagica]
MSEHKQPSSTEFVEHTDLGVSLTVKLKRGTGTRDEDQGQGESEDAREDMETLRTDIHVLAEDTRQIQPEEEDK